jgi:aminoglycoside phosphotransferase (APT) family kinase protein
VCWGDRRLSNILYGPQFEVAAVLDWEIAYIGDHEADLAWMLFVDWACSEYEGVPRLDGTPTREETVDRYEQLSGRTVRTALQRSARGRTRHPDLATGDQAAQRGTADRRFDLAGFCVERIRQLLD